MTTLHDIQRAADAAFFEDWSTWTSLDDLPLADKRRGYYVQWPVQHNRYWCILRHRIDWLGGAAFELSLPPNRSIQSLVGALPGARRHPALNGIHREAYSRLRDTWFVPAHCWRELRAALPEIKRRVVALVAS